MRCPSPLLRPRVVMSTVRSRSSARLTASSMPSGTTERALAFRGPAGAAGKLRHVPATVIVGAQWGDEGKGKIVDLLAQECDLVCRYNGGPNAGHTITVEGE